MAVGGYLIQLHNYSLYSCLLVNVVRETMLDSGYNTQSVELQNRSKIV